MARIHPLLLVGTLGASFIACVERGPGFDVIPLVDVPTGVDATVDATADARDGASDARRDGMGADGPMCDFALCDMACVQAACSGGACREGRCACIGCPGQDGGTLTDVPPPVDVIFRCMNNDDCISPGLFCNGVGCGTPGFCSPRTEPTSCDPPTWHCGCDGVRYRSICERIRAGVRRNPMDGMCPPHVPDGGPMDVTPGG